LFFSNFWRISDSPGGLCGAARGIRTPDPIITNDVLYQLSYCGVGAASTPAFSYRRDYGFSSRESNK
jgi:hypothetical protein